ncbi:hypothetical protein J2X20_005651 [Pelomonas saccharophila]|uniref:Uncharacterized protein n=1 Tax=Roseateles saccharophilus TaxID=304 RepID=A0ABU1YY50_ROSSA|nr:hypothetical protein [Roseateles saccharophilus]MDR7272966.1 hypothetical protein [Roseateles saccharophilus]
MNISQLLGLALKDDQIVDLLEHYGVDVIYDFDRLRENTPDRYSASFHDGGFEFIFSDAQLLRTIFLYASSRGKFKPIRPDYAGVPLYQSFREAKGAFERAGIPIQVSKSDEGYVKGSFGDRTVHYEFRAEALVLVTISLANA